MLFKKNCLCFKKHIFVPLKNYGTFLNYLMTFILILERFLYGCRRFLPKPQQKKLFPAHRSADNSILLSFFSISFSFICNKKRGWGCWQATVSVFDNKAPRSAQFLSLGIILTTLWKVAPRIKFFFVLS